MSWNNRSSSFDANSVSPVLLTRVSLDQFVLTPVLVGTFFTVQSLLEGKGLGEARRRVEENWWPTLQKNWGLFSELPVPSQARFVADNDLAVQSPFSSSTLPSRHRICASCWSTSFRWAGMRTCLTPTGRRSRRLRRSRRSRRSSSRWRPKRRRAEEPVDHRASSGKIPGAKQVSRLDTHGGGARRDGGASLRRTRHQHSRLHGAQRNW